MASPTTSSPSSSSQAALSALELRVLAAIDRRERDLLEDLRLHVGLPTGGDGPALDEERGIFAERLKKLGAAIELVPGDPRPQWLGAGARAVPPTLVARRLAGKRGNKVLLSGHLDTVHDPNSSFRKLEVAPDGRTATGPGCVDMKGGLVIAMAALEALAEAGVEVAWSFILNSDEETGSYHSDRTLQRVAGEHNYGIALEPALPDGSLVIERPGSGQFVVETVGKSAHVGRDFKSGVSAINAMGGILQRVAALPDQDLGLIVNIGVINGGTAANVVPDHCRALGNVRVFNTKAAEHVMRELRALETPADALPRVKVQASLNRPAKPLTPQVEAFALMARKAAEDLGQSLPFGKTGGVCDGNNLQAGGLATIDTLGVRGGGLHTPEEWIDVSSLVERGRLLALLLTRLHEHGSTS
ncbi:MAG: M20/M25/M40 family metallo-hydrolase [Planctomycetota bacterium]|nr:M20/M25/M40 family metallo-hydrolase [Planctomycetota bacterium]